MISQKTSKEDLQKLLTVVIDYKEKEKLEKENPIASLAEFKLPLWKRTFDILASGTAILCLSPLLLITALAIRAESNGKIVYKSKRVGSNYRISIFISFVPCIRMLISDCQNIKS